MSLYDIHSVCYVLSQSESNNKVDNNDLKNIHNIHCKNKYWSMTKSGMKKSNTFHNYKNFMKEHMIKESYNNYIDGLRHSFP